MVEKVLLELIQDQQEIAVERRGPCLQGRHERRRGRRRQRRGRGVQRPQVGLQSRIDAVEQAAQRVIAPGIDDDHDEFRVAAVNLVLDGEMAQMMHHARAQHRTLAHAAGAVKQRQAGSDQIGLDHVALTLSAKKEVGVLFAIRDQPFVGRERRVLIAHGRPPAAGRFCTRSLKPATNCSRLRSRMSTL